MMEFDAKLMTDEELKTAANELFDRQEQDFEKIKSEKWYKTLFSAITLNQDGRKYVVNGMKSLAKLQQLFLDIYVKNYREMHQEIDDIIESVIQTNETLNKLYGSCVLDIERQEDLSSLSNFDAEILALFLYEYRDENGNIPEKVSKYNYGVLMGLNQNVPYGKLDRHQLRKLNAPKVVYRCLMEQCAVDGTLDTQEWSDNIYDLIKDFELGENTKEEIREAVKREIEIAGIDYLMDKYTKGIKGNPGHNVEEMFTLEDFEIETNEVGNMNIKEEGASLSQDVGDTNNDKEAAYSGEREDEYIDNILQIPAGTVKRYVNKNIHISAYINCAGTLEFDNCCIYYNESNNADEIAMEEKAKLSIVNSVVICSGLDKTPFISGRNGFEVSLIATKFSDCSYFLNAYCNSFYMIGCTVENCFHEFIHVSGPQICEIQDNKIIHDDLAGFNFLDDYSMTEISIDTNEKVQGYFKNNVFIETDNFKDICKNNLKQWLKCLSFESELPVSNCTFNGISENITVYSIRNCRFEKCSGGIIVYSRANSSVIIENCVFHECTRAINAYSKKVKILNCQFISCYETIIDGSLWGGKVIEYCEFINIRYKTPEDKIFGTEEYTDQVYSATGEASISLYREKDENANYIRKCIFNGVDMDHAYVICGKTNYKLSNYVIYMEDCSFASCATKRKDEEIIKMYDHYYPKFSKKPREVKTVQLSNCKGLNKVNKEGSYTENFKVKTMDASGNPIGASIQI